LLLHSSYLPLGVPNWPVIFIIITAASRLFLAPLPGRKKKTSARGVLHAHPLLSFKVLLYFIFTCIIYIKNPKKLVSL
jgi:hypothetical protein